MKIALYNENLRELEILLGQLDQCAREYLRFVEITLYVRQEDFCSLVRDGPEVDLFVVAQDGTFSLEIMELLWEKRPHAHIFWFSDLDFALRAYRYNADWFGKKPVDIHSLRKAFGQILYRRELMTVLLKKCTEQGAESNTGKKRRY